MVPSFHTVLFLQKIRKILKLFSHLQRRMRVQVDRPKGLNSLSLWEPKMKKNHQSLTLCQGKTNARRGLNLYDVLLWRSKRIYNVPELLKIV